MSKNRFCTGITVVVSVAVLAEHKIKVSLIVGKITQNVCEWIRIGLISEAL